MKLKLIETRPTHPKHIKKYRVVNAETGEILDGVLSINHKISCNGQITILELVDVDYEIEIENRGWND